MYPSVRAFVMSLSRLGAGIMNFTAGPSPPPPFPWHTAQFTWKYFQPRSTEACVAGSGFLRYDMESTAPSVCAYDTWYGMITAPVVGTEPCGCPRDGVVVSVQSTFNDCHGPTDGCCRKSVSQ